MWLGSGWKRRGVVRVGMEEAGCGVRVGMEEAGCEVRVGMEEAGCGR